MLKASSTSHAYTTIPTHVQTWAPQMDQLVFSTHLDRLKGRVLTVVDASFTDPRQRKAVKDLLREAFRKSRYEGYEFFFGKEYVMSIGETNEVPEETI
jgi:hypothetical protein